MIKWILVLLVFCQVAIGSVLLNEEEFTDRYVEKALNMIEGVKAVKQGNLEVKFIDNEGEERSSFLNNAYANYKNDPESVNLIIERYAESLKDLFNQTPER